MKNFKTIETMDFVTGYIKDMRTGYIVREATKEELKRYKEKIDMITKG